MAISCWDNTDKKSYTYQNLDGIDIDKMAGIKDSYGTIDQDKALALGCKRLDGDAWLSQDVDILIPASENQINWIILHRLVLKLRSYVRQLMSPTTPETDHLLKKRNLSNSGFLYVQVE